MTILHLIESLDVGGAERALVTLARQTVQAGHACHVAALFGQGELAAELEAAGATVHLLNVPHRWAVGNVRRALLRLRRTVRYHVLHTHLFFADLYGALFLPGPHVVTFHNLTYEASSARSWRMALHRRLYRYALRRSAARVGVSRAVAQHYTAHLGADTVDVVPNGTAFPLPPPARQRSELMRRYDLPADRVWAVMPGRLVAEKAHDVLFEALATLAAEGSVRPLVLLAGDGPLRALLEEKARQLGVMEDVRFLGHLSQPELLDVLHASAFAVLSSRSEGLGVALVEALGTGLPAVATTAGGIVDVVQHDVSGFLVPPEEVASLAAALGRMVRLDPARREAMGAAGRLWVEEHFADKAVAYRYLALYARVRAEASRAKKERSASGCHA